MDRQLRKMLVLKIEADILHFVFEANAECGLKKLSAHWVCTTKFDLHTECALQMFYSTLNVITQWMSIKKNYVHTECKFYSIENVQKVKI
jgi:hypothetical protein